MPSAEFSRAQFSSSVSKQVNGENKPVKVSVFLKRIGLVLAVTLVMLLAFNALSYINFNPQYGFLKLKQKAIATGWVPFILLFTCFSCRRNFGNGHFSASSDIPKKISARSPMARILLCNGNFIFCHAWRTSYEFFYRSRIHSPRQFFMTNSALVLLYCYGMTGLEKRILKAIARGCGAVMPLHLPQ